MSTSADTLTAARRLESLGCAVAHASDPSAAAAHIARRACAVVVFDSRDPDPSALDTLAASAAGVRPAWVAVVAASIEAQALATLRSRCDQLVIDRDLDTRLAFGVMGAIESYSLRVAAARLRDDLDRRGRSSLIPAASPTPSEPVCEGKLPAAIRTVIAEASVVSARLEHALDAMRKLPDVAAARTGGGSAAGDPPAAELLDGVAHELDGAMQTLERLRRAIAPVAAAS